MKKKDQEIPRLVAIETSNYCNAKCTFCPNSSLKRDRQLMDQNLFEKILDDCTHFPLPAIEPLLNGEPFTDPMIMGRLALIRQRLPNTKLRLYTNGYALKHSRIDELSDIGIDDLFVSLNTLDDQKYKDQMGLSLQKTIDNINYLAHHPNRNRIARSITVRMTRLKDTTANDQMRFVEYCRTIKVKPFIVGLYNYKGDVESFLPVPNFPCANITRIDILVSGIVTLCCMDQEGKYTWGDVRNDSVLDIHNSAMAREVRIAHRRGRRKHFYPCNICNYYMPSTKKTNLMRRLLFAIEKRRYWNLYRPEGVYVE